MARTPDDPLRILYTADMRLLSGDPAGARPLYEAAIDLLEGGRRQRTADKVMTAVGRFALAGAFYQLSDYGRAAASLGAHIAGVRNIARTLRSNDPKVREEFEKLIDGRERERDAVLRERSKP